MGDIVNTILLVAAVFFALVGVFFLLRALNSRMSVSDGSYGVARQEARQTTLVNVTRGIFFLFLALISFAAMGLVPSSQPEEPEVTLTPTAEQVAPVTAAATSTDASVTVEAPTATITVLSRTPFPTDTPEPTSTPILPSALVNSLNGLWLREAPGGVQEVELLPNGAVLILLAGLEIADEIEWQEVRTQSGNVGWVAVDFIEYQQ